MKSKISKNNLKFDDKIRNIKVNFFQVIKCKQILLFFRL